MLPSVGAVSSATIGMPLPTACAAGRVKIGGSRFSSTIPSGWVTVRFWNSCCSAGPSVLGGPTTLKSMFPARFAASVAPSYISRAKFRL